MQYIIICYYVSVVKENILFYFSLVYSILFYSILFYQYFNWHLLCTNVQAYSWGFGGYGRLGHAETGDELVPRIIKFLDQKNRGVRSSSLSLISYAFIPDPGSWI
jgi:hypothetical protein